MHKSNNKILRMDDRHREKLRSNRVALIKDLIVNEDLLAQMEQNDIFTPSMVEEIEVKPTKQKRASELLNVLTRRGPDAFRVFVDALVCTGQTHLAKLLEPGITGQGKESRNEYRPLRQPSQPMEEDDERGILPVKVHPVDEIEAAKKLNEGGIYTMSSNPRGRAIIISNEHFQGACHPTRDGSIWDLVNLQELFRQLGFETFTYSDLTAKEIGDKLEEESSLQQPSANAFFLCILSHGAKGLIFGADGRTISIEKITTMFDGNHCQALSGKPKVFIIQACQGEDSTQGVPQSDGSESVDAEMESRLRELRIGDTPDSMPSLPNVHEKADMVLAYSTVTGYKSWRLPESGSWYIRELVKTFAHFACKEHFMDLLVKVQDQVSKKHTYFDRHTSSGLYVQMPEMRTTLRKKLYLFPGYYG
ncbi:Caspase-2 [Lamellibrachia satsuma]|nr:Caspase-2 [Lamellibrachia satsuma]